MKKIGLLGGTFDPVHNGHLIISEYLRDEMELDEIWFIPAKIHPLKNNQNITSEADRLKMLEFAIGNNSHFRVSDVEIKREGVSYTIDTLNELSEKYQEIKPQFYFLIGMDNVNELNKWKEPNKILNQATLVAFGRPGFTPDDTAKEFLSKIKFVHVPLLEISSTFIRSRIKNGHSVRYLIPETVDRYIQEKQLYK